MSADCNENLKQTLREFKRQALHATKLGLLHPETNEYCEWEQSVPEDMANLLKALEQDELDQA
jgi:23S rRNA pseudouridine1911/1915/1917 synthase